MVMTNKNNSTNILFTGVGRRIELLQAFRSAAMVLNKDIRIFGADMAGTAPALAFCDYTRRVAAMRDSNYIDDLLSICKDDNITLLIPTIDTDLLVLSENKRIFENIGTRVMISAPNNIRLCRDKNYTSQFFINCGLHAPLPVNEWKQYSDGYPAFIKPKDGSSSINAYKVNNVKELELYASQIEDYIVQPFVEGIEYTIDIFCDWSGNPLSIVPRERVQVRAGEVLKTKITMDNTMIEESKILCEHFKPCGPLTVQLIREKNTGIDFFIEINPRFGGGAPLSMKAGAKSAELILKLLNNEQVEYCSNISNNAIYSRFDQSVCIHECNSDIKGVIFDLDDTLYSEKEYVKSGFRAVSDYLGGGYEEKLWSFFMNGERAIDELLKTIHKSIERDKVIDVYRNHIPQIQLYEGVKDLLKYLRSKKIKVGIITDGRPIGQRNKINALGLTNLIDDVIITDELGGIQFRKPNDISFRIMQNRMRLSFEQIVYVGDNPNKDFQAPKQLGMKCMYVKNADGLYFDNEFVFENTIKSVKELKCII